MMRQSTFFDRESKAGEQDAERILLYALGDFQQRGKVLAERDLPFDRLRGAFRRAAEAFDARELGDEEVAAALSALGANVRRVPVFFAKHPFRIVVPTSLAERAHAFFLETKKTD
ncbi:MAG: hypothetical protein QOJ70_2881 [Acidobacteriota bacterium]|jgi:hypothetical protein|nr:hypothetical protein [Acidobacteriota bacterium]